MASPDKPPRAILETCLYCENLEAARVFYERVLGLQPVHADERNIFFRVGDRMLLLFDPAKTESTVNVVEGAAIPRHGSHGPGHLAFAAEEDEIEAWATRLREHGVRIEAEVRWPSGGRSIYFRDPSGNVLEFADPSIWHIEVTG